MTFIVFLILVVLFAGLMRKGNRTRALRRNYMRNGVAKQLPLSKVARRIEDYL